MGFEEMKRLRDEAKESQVRKPLDSVSAPGAETNQTNQPKEVARTIADKAKKIGKKKNNVNVAKCPPNVRLKYCLGALRRFLYGFGKILAVV